MIDLKAIRDRLNAATPLPWCWSFTGTKDNGYIIGTACDEEGRPLSGHVSLDQELFDPVMIGELEAATVNYGNPEFIVNAKQDIAALIEAVERLEPFLDYCAGEGVLIGGVDSADLYIEMFPEKYRAALSAKDKGEEK